MSDTEHLIELLRNYEKREFFDVDLRYDSYATGYIDGLPTLIGISRPESLRIRFASDGSLLGYEETGYTFDVDIESLISRLNLQPGSIRIKGFYIPEEYIGVKALPEIIYDFLSDPDTFFESESEIKYLTAEMERWVRDQCFVLIWNEEDEINPTMP